jgi:Holliday junction resolvasome RuvABC endonuclease subunit
MAKKKASKANPAVASIRTDTTRVNVIRDVRTLAPVPGVARRRPRAVALDLATNTGLAYADFDPRVPVSLEALTPVFLGQLDLSAASYESGAIRFTRLMTALEHLQPSIIFYEQVRFTPSGPMSMATLSMIMARTYSTAELIGAFKAVACAYAEKHGIPCCGLAIGEIKRRATNHGNANKVDMINACNEYFQTDFSSENYETTGVDNIADAAWILVRGLEMYADGVVFTPPLINLEHVALEDLQSEILRRQRAEAVKHVGSCEDRDVGGDTSSGNRDGDGTGDNTGDYAGDSTRDPDVAPARG